MDKFTYQAEEAVANMIEMYQIGNYEATQEWAQEANRLLDEAYEEFEDDDSLVCERMYTVEENISHYVGVI